MASAQARNKERMTQPPTDAGAIQPRSRHGLRAVQQDAGTALLQAAGDLARGREGPDQRQVVVPIGRYRSPKRAAIRYNLAMRALQPALDPDPEETPPGTEHTAPQSQAQPSIPEVRSARMHLRHWVMLASFLLSVVAPLAVVATYLWTRAADQYHSEVAFSIRSEEIASAAAGLIGALTQMSSGTASDADILYEYIRSQEIVARIDETLDLHAIYNHAEGDPYFTLGPAREIEALHSQWGRMVEVNFESGTGIIHVQARAFTPEDATAVAGQILAQSNALVNALSEQAREDAIRFARDELAEATENLRTVRGELSEFRRRYNVIDPGADVAGQMSLLNALSAELAQALVDRDVLTSYSGEGDQRVAQADRRIAAITARLNEERNSLGINGVSATLPELVGRYEELLVDLEFASTAYTQALAGLAAARAEARRQSRYLAPHIQPTSAESALYPRRSLIAGLTGMFLLLGWGILMLAYYNVRDNR